MQWWLQQSCVPGAEFRTNVDALAVWDKDARGRDSMAVESARIYIGFLDFDLGRHFVSLIRALIFLR